MADGILDQLRGELSSLEELVLRACNIRDAEELYVLSQIFPSLAQHGVDLQKLCGLATTCCAEGVARVARSSAGRSPAAVLGAKPPSTAPAPVGYVVPLPRRPALVLPRLRVPRIDLRPRSWPVRDQGLRGTCVAHALVACREHLGFEQGGRPERYDLSEQFLYWATKSQTGDPEPDEDGTLLEFAAEALARHGVCKEKRWPYNPRAERDNITQSRPGVPSETARWKARRNSYVAQHCWAVSSRGAAALLYSLLARRRPAAISVPVFADPHAVGWDNWNTPLSAFGVVMDPVATSMVIGGHAVCVVGFAPDSAEPMGGYFIFRNSWGTGWASSAPSENRHAPAPGYGQISASYVDAYTWEYCAL